MSEDEVFKVIASYARGWGQPELHKDTQKETGRAGSAVKGMDAIAEDVDSIYSTHMDGCSQ